MNVLSLFDGMSCGQIALARAGIKVDNYYASEIDKYAIKVTMANYPNTIQLGSVINVSASSLPKIDLLIGGSPCQGFSFAGKQLNFEDERSKLFFEYVRLLEEVRQVNPSVYFFLENVKMKKRNEDVISNLLGVRPIRLNSALVSAQNRQRLYWTNIAIKSLPQDKKLMLKHIVEDGNDYEGAAQRGRYGKDKKVFQQIEFNGTHKSNSLTTVRKGTLIVQLNPSKESGGKQPYMQNRVYDSNYKSVALTQVCDRLKVLHNGQIRNLTPIECERLQTVPDNYTNYVSDSQRYKMLGNGWTIDIVAHIFNHLPLEYKIKK